MYIGKTPTVGNFQKCDALTASATADYTLQVGSANVSPESVNHMIVSLNGVIQAPTTAYTVAGAVLSFASALTSADSIDFVLLLGNVLDIGTPSDNTVATAKIQDDAVTLAKMAAGTDGNVISYDASGNPVAIATGSDGQVLTSTGAGSPPAFEAAGGGAILQVKTGKYYGSTNVSTTSTTPTWVGTHHSDFATASSVTITPASTASVFHVYLQMPMYLDDYGSIKLYRDIGAAGYTQLTGAQHWHGLNVYVMMVIEHWDAPATASDVTYRMYANNHSGTIGLNQIGSLNSIYGGIITTVTEYDGSKVTIAED